MDRDENSHSVENIVEHVSALPIPDQLDILRRLAVAILPGLDDDDRAEFIDDLNVALSRALPIVHAAPR